MTDVDLGKVKRNVATMVQKGAPESDIDSYISQSGTTVDAVKNHKLDSAPSEEPGFMERVKSDMAQRDKNQAEISQATISGEQNPLSGWYQHSGQVLGEMGDVTGEAIKSGIKYLPEEPKKNIKAAYESVAKPVRESEFGKTVSGLMKEGGETYKEFRKEHPEEARNVEATLNFLNAAPAGVGTKAAGKATEMMGKVTESAGAALKKSAAEQPKKEVEAFAKELASPEKTKAVKESEIGRSPEKGIFRKRDATPTPQEMSAAREISKLPLDPKRSLNHNFGIIREAMVNEANRLMVELKQSRVKYDKGVLDKKLDTNYDELLKKSGIVGDKEAQTLKIVNKMKEIVALHPDTPAGLLQARQDFDKWARSERETIAFDSQKAWNVAMLDTRRVVNRHIGEIVRVPDPQRLAELHVAANTATIELANLNGLKDHLVQSVQQATKDAQQMGGFWRQRAITRAANDAKSLANVKSQIARQEIRLKKAKDTIDRLPKFSTDVEASLKKQSNYYSAMDNLRPKAAKEAVSGPGRFIQKYEPDIQTKMLKHAVGAGAAATAGVAHGAYKAATGPTAKKIVGGAAGLTGKGLQKIGGMVDSDFTTILQKIKP